MKLFRKIFLLFVLTISLFAQSKEEILQKANNAYQNQDYLESLKLYNSVVQDGYASAELYYNLGNSYFKTDQLGYAILYYEKALKYNPSDEDIQHNLAIAKARTVDQIKEVPQLFIVDWFNYYLAIFPVSGWTVLLYVFYLAFLISVGIFFLSRKLRIKRTSLFSSAITFVISILLGLTLLAKVNQETSSHYGILIMQNITAKNSPDFQSNDAFIINEGIKFEIEDTVNDWGKIKLADGKVGWLPKSSYEKI